MKILFLTSSMALTALNRHQRNIWLLDWVLHVCQFPQGCRQTSQVDCCSSEKKNYISEIHLKCCFLWEAWGTHLPLPMATLALAPSTGAPILSLLPYAVHILFTSIIAAWHHSHHIVHVSFHDCNPALVEKHFGDRLVSDSSLYSQDNDWNREEARGIVYKIA